MLDIGANLQAVRRRIAVAAARAGRSPDEVALLAVSKRVARADIEAALAAGARSLGESRVQEAEAKIADLGDAATWHFIGPLQRNKATLAARLFDVVHSVDREALVSRLSSGAEAAGRTLRVYAQIEALTTPPGDDLVASAVGLCRALEAARGLQLEGLMTMAPYDPDPEAARPYFAALRRLRDGIAAITGFAPLGLSMGMSGDFEVAIEEGATIVRVGTAIFGERSP